MTDTTHLGLPFIEDSQAQKHVTHNEALRILDAVIQIVVEDMTRTTPPASPTEGQRHVVASGASGAWFGYAGAIATWQDGAWVYLTPKTGWCLWSIADATIFIFDGGAWQALAPLANDVGQLGVNTTASTPNLLSVKSNAALLAAIATADGGSGDARLQIAKETEGNTASVFFSDNYSGRAEFGFIGDDHFRLKVSSDGASWQDAFVIDRTTATVSFNGFSDAAATRRQLSAPVRAITGSDTIVASDIGRTLIFNSTSAVAVAVTAAAILGNGFWCRFKNVSSGLVTIDPNSGETIDGLTTAIVPKFDAGTLICDGAALHTLERSPSILLGSGEFASSATLDLNLPAGFAEIEINMTDIKPSVAGAILGRISADNGSTWETGYNTSWWYNSPQTSTMTAGGLTSQSYLRIPATLITGNSGGSTKIILQNAVNNASYLKMYGVCQNQHSSGNQQMVHFQNWLSTFNGYNFLQLFPESGAWTTGCWQIYGKRKMN